MNHIEKKPFGTAPDGKEVFLFILVNENGMRAEILNYGCAVRALYVPDRTGVPTDVVLGYDGLDGYVRQDKYLGSIAGRVCNRIAKGLFTLNGKEYRLACNDGENHLHGGTEGFDKKVFTPEILVDKLCLSYTSPDGEEGYPGTLKVMVTYSLTRENTLRITYKAISDKDTLCSLTNHSYFNLDGCESGTAYSQNIRINADFYTPINKNLIPDGTLAPVEGTPLDLRRAVPLGSRIGAEHPQFSFAGGFDFNYVVNGHTGQFREAAYAQSARSGITLSVWSGLPGIQFYSGNFLEGAPAGKGGGPYHNGDGFCLETQFFPDAVNHPNFFSAFLPAGKTAETVTEYRFGLIE